VSTDGLTTGAGVTKRSAARVFAEVFPRDHITIRAYGNVLTAISFLQGLALAELTTDELECYDPNFELLLSVRAVKPESEIHN
jgi:hypothetical protein